MSRCVGLRTARSPYSALRRRNRLLKSYSHGGRKPLDRYGESIDIPSCKECRTIVQAILRPGKYMRSSSKSTVWGYEKARKNTQCRSCQALVESFDWSIREYTPAHLRDHHMVGTLRFVSHYWSLVVVAPVPKPTGYTFTPELRLLQTGPRPIFSKGVGLEVDQQINLFIIKRWLLQCDQCHSNVCHTLLDPWERMERAEDLIYIDVKRCCLVDQRDLPKDFSYVALSYVWGHDPQPVQTLLRNLADFKTPGAFDEAAHPGLLPKTIQDTIALVRSLGLGYAWIDRLCIVQDHMSDKSRQLAAMASIYVNAYVTIVASDGDAQTGLAGTRKVRPRQAPYKAFNLSTTCHLVDYDNTFERNVADLTYHTRGWTFQEWTLSRRLLIFHNNTVSWQCERRQSRENGAGLKSLNLWKSEPRNTSGGFIHKRNRPIWTSWPNIESYLYNVEEYARRALSYAEDTLNAIRAIINVQTRNMKGEVMYGHPELFFTGTLLWMHVEPSQMLPDQVAIAIQGPEDFSVFPSWSWTSRLQPLNMKLAVAATKYITRLDDGQLTCVYPKHFHTISMYRASNNCDAASQHIIKDMHYWADSSRLKDMRTNALPKNRAFNSYIPLLDSLNTTSPRTEGLQENLVSFRTARIFARLTRDVADDGCILGPRCIPNHGPYLLDNLERMIGHIYISPQSPADQDIDNSCSLELINIGGMEIDWNLWAWDTLHKSAGYLHRHCPKRDAVMPKCLLNPSACSLGPDWRCRFYNVLWIRRRNGIAYRKELGLVWAESWESAMPEDVDIVLG